MKLANEFLARVPAAFYTSGVDVGAHCIWEGEKTACTKAKTSFQRFLPTYGAIRSKKCGCILNPRTGKTYFEGDGQPEVRQVLQHLRGDDFCHIGAHLDYFLGLPRASWRKSSTWWRSRPIRNLLVLPQ